ncbi:hypothetical protein AVO44_18965 [Ruegeria profundi]|uniref:Uncharacterized protein n=1 Tax=Ruegeria profundi TaxID=1685378 RepID=A0A0X3TQ09_9RHOB|nr:hypothetical protein AVO44_18965 [Ruegeria profundi]
MENIELKCDRTVVGQTDKLSDIVLTVIPSFIIAQIRNSLLLKAAGFRASKIGTMPISRIFLRWWLRVWSD